MSNIIRNDLATTNKLRVVKSFYDSLAKGDVPAVLGLLDPQVSGRRPSAFRITQAPGSDRRRCSTTS